MQDIRSYSNVRLQYELNIIPRMIELAIIMNNYKRITVYDIGEHDIREDVDADQYSCTVVGPNYCAKCGKTINEITTNECRRRIGKK